MNAPWQQDKARADVFASTIKLILGERFMCEATLQEDQEHNTDLMVFKLEPIRIACRVRRASYLVQYPAEFTIRASRPSGALSEWDKLVNGWGDWMFYGFGDFDHGVLLAWRLIDLRAFRAALIRGFPVPEPKRNGDKSSDFYAFNADRLRALDPTAATTLIYSRNPRAVALISQTRGS